MKKVKRISVAFVGIGILTTSFALSTQLGMHYNSNEGNFINEQIFKNYTNSLLDTKNNRNTISDNFQRNDEKQIGKIEKLNKIKLNIVKEIQNLVITFNLNKNKLW